MSTPEHSDPRPDAPPRLVVAFDFDRPGIAALRQAVERAACREDAEVHLLVARTIGDDSSAWVSQEVGRHVRDATAECSGSRPRVVTHFRPGPLSAAIPRLAVEVDASLVVLDRTRLQGSQGKALRRALDVQNQAVVVVEPPES